MDRATWQATVHGVARVGHDLATKTPPPAPPHLFKGVTPEMFPCKEQHNRKCWPWSQVNLEWILTLLFIRFWPWIEYLPYLNKKWDRVSIQIWHKIIYTYFFDAAMDISLVLRAIRWMYLNLGTHINIKWKIYTKDIERNLFWTCLLWLQPSLQKTQLPLTLFYGSFLWIQLPWKKTSHSLA